VAVAAWIKADRLNTLNSTWANTGERTAHVRCNSFKNAMATRTIKTVSVPSFESSPTRLRMQPSVSGMDWRMPSRPVAKLQKNAKQSQYYFDATLLSTKT
jgi:hypothetical protein